MGSDNIVFQALTVTLTLVGLVTSGLLWRARGPVSGLRILALSLLPAAALFTGTLELIWEIGNAVASWAVGFAFSPIVWLGIMIAGVSAALFVVSSGMRKRGIGTQGRTPKQPGPSGELPARPSRTAARAPNAAAPKDDDLDDIEAILKKHGIT